MSSTNIFPVLSVLYNLNRHHKKYYCFPSQIKILELLEKFQGICRCERTLNRWLRVIEDQGYIRRRRRIRSDPDRGTVFQSTLYLITRKGYQLLARAGVNCWNILKKIFSGRQQPLRRSNVPDLPPIPPDEAITFEEMRSIWRNKKARLRAARP